MSYIATPVRPVTSTSGPFTRATRAALVGHGVHSSRTWSPSASTARLASLGQRAVDDHAADRATTPPAGYAVIVAPGPAAAAAMCGEPAEQPPVAGLGPQPGDRRRTWPRRSSHASRCAPSTIDRARSRAWLRSAAAAAARPPGPRRGCGARRARSSARLARARPTIAAASALARRGMRAARRQRVQQCAPDRRERLPPADLGRRSCRHHHQQHLAPRLRRLAEPGGRAGGQHQDGDVRRQRVPGRAGLLGVLRRQTTAPARAKPAVARTRR